jgi:hypothetical protein
MLEVLFSSRTAHAISPSLTVVHTKLPMLNNVRKDGTDKNKAKEPAPNANDENHCILLLSQHMKKRCSNSIGGGHDPHNNDTN